MRKIYLLLLTVFIFAAITNAQVNVPYSQNFDAVTAPAIPPGIVVTNDNGDSHQWMTDDGTEGGPAASGANAMYIRWNGALAMDDWFFLPAINMTGGVSYRITFKYSSGGFYTEKLKVRYGSGPTAAAMTTTLVDLPAISNDTYTQVDYDFTPAGSGAYVIGFQGYSDADQFYINVDDIAVDLTPSCAAPTRSYCWFCYDNLCFCKLYIFG
ncbi:MAG: choice-of-anchor J domain-containing protein [Bacteroidota bacterium]